MDIYYKILENKLNNQWLMFVHGFTQNHKVFLNQIDEFKNGFNIILVDLRGHGLSKDGMGAYGIEEYADDLEVVFKKSKIEQLYYWGTHTGTAIGMLLYLRNPNRFKALIMEGSVLPGYDMPRVKELIDRAKKISYSEGIEIAKDDWFFKADWFSYINENPYKCKKEEHYKLIKEFRGEPWISKKLPKDVTNIDSRLHEIKIPTLIYNGKYDMPDFIKVADRLEKNIKNIKRLVIEGAGGFPCWENPDKVNLVVKEYLKRAF